MPARCRIHRPIPESTRSPGAPKTSDSSRRRRIDTLGGVLDHYAAGGRTIAEGPNRGIGHDNVNKSRSVRGFTLTADQRADLLAFLNSLTDDMLLHDSRFADPWRQATQETR